uniref:DNA-directed DNA polymerase n=1 Tax=Meloidogyne hapla TaxID=6305 RepID=A0A1I8C3I6_MELHA
MGSVGTEMQFIKGGKIENIIVKLSSKDLITRSPVELHEVLNDPKLDVGAVEMLATDLYAVPYQSKREFVRPHDKYNIFIALITTATARVFLYDYMEQIFNDPDCKLLYTDTDSCYIVHPKGKAPPFQVGDMLGMMSREYEDNHILAIYIGGCKQYAMKMRTKTGEIKYVVKCRGCWESADSPLDFNKLKQMVNAYGEEQEPVVLERTHFRPNWRRGEVTTRTQKRRYTPIYDKGMIDDKHDCYPFGYRGNPISNPIE